MSQQRQMFIWAAGVAGFEIKDFVAIPQSFSDARVELFKNQPRGDCVRLSIPNYINSIDAALALADSAGVEIHVRYFKGTAMVWAAHMAPPEAIEHENVAAAITACVLLSKGIFRADIDGMIG